MAVEKVKVGKSIQKHLRIGPRKVRPVLDIIRRKNIDQAVITLKNSNKKAARLILLGLKSAIANAKVLKLDEARLYVTEAKADGGPTLKRFMTRSMGRADTLLKRTTHITVVVSEGRKAFREVKEETKETKAKTAPAPKKDNKEKVKSQTTKAKPAAKKKSGEKK